MKAAPTPDALLERWDALSRMDRPTLRVSWSKAFKNAPPHFLSIGFMRKALIWHAQCQASGHLAPEVKRALRASAGGKTVRRLAPVIRKGTQFVREWNGRTYTVDVTETGYIMNGERFKSLSAIALHITGTTWSGPRFFGVSKAERSVA